MQTMPCQEIEEILSKYQKDEDKIENLLQQTNKQQHEISSDDRNRGRSSKFLSYEEAKERNKTILKELETVKGNLRSKAIFSPAEMQWEKICKRYQENPSLPVVTWRCNHPVFV